MGVRVSGPKLAAAVANAGGVSIISSVGWGLKRLQMENPVQAGERIGDRSLAANRDALILHALDRAASGDVENGLIFAGSNAGRSDRLRPVADLMAELVASAPANDP